ncbi:MAG: hypothetical protein WKH64_14690 [Chloroflexia bacterium]
MQVDVPAAGIPNAPEYVGTDGLLTIRVRMNDSFQRAVEDLRLLVEGRKE